MLTVYRVIDRVLVCAKLTTRGHAHILYPIFWAEFESSVRYFAPNPNPAKQPPLALALPKQL